MNSFEGKFALVTGAARGNGEGIARVIMERGGTVAMTDISETVFETAKALGGNSKAYIMNVADRVSIETAVAKILVDFGRIDILVNNAGISIIKPFEECTVEIRDRYWQVLQNGVWDCTQAVIPHMVKNKYGRIVNISSVTGPVVCNGSTAVYSTAKASLIGLTRSIAIEYADKNITCNAVLPGFILTPMVEESAARRNPENPQQILDRYASGIPMGRLGTPRDIGNAVAFLASDDAEYITGISLIVDGGNTIPEG
jgi:NAD(P)-dependent dehydrogenase (short-subunit alcohol dehydrogenase family)